MRVLITGASGFVGKNLLESLGHRNHKVRAAVRSQVKRSGIAFVRSPDLGPEADWYEALVETDVVVHLAGLAHSASEKTDPETEKHYLRTNAEGSRRLAEQCVDAGVKHFVFLSSCHAVTSESATLVTNHTVPRPATAYGRSKLAAEESIKNALANSDCAWTILRPPLVYGRGNKANFGLLVKLVETGLPLPFASVRNRRSFVYLENLTDLIVACLGNPHAFGKTFYPSDQDDISTPELIRKIVKVGVANRELACSHGFVVASGVRLFPFPEKIFKTMGRLPGLRALQKLTSSLYVDGEQLRRDLAWNPPFTMDEGLRRTLDEAAES